MRFSNFSPVVFLLGLGLAHNETGPGGHFWNTTTAHPAPTSSCFFAITNTSFIEEVATIKIQIGNLSGSGVINLSNVATPSEAAQLSDLLDPTSFINQPHQTEANSSLSTFCPPNTTAALPYRELLQKFAIFHFHARIHCWPAAPDTKA
ncbi:hypothetical protein DL95DRAFT_419262 [Leptodontidium sp. 2 PMI_412]|nr:hypothetical protein DL95DRAFT_419262 [Leptodontidium sp. 2 PMI_412]